MLVCLVHFTGRQIMETEGTLHEILLILPWKFSTHGQRVLVRIRAPMNEPDRLILILFLDMPWSSPVAKIMSVSL